jgi:hypothetical protein
MRNTRFHFEEFHKSSRIRNAVVLAAVLLTAVIGLIASRIQHAYGSNYPLFYDPVEYSYHNARLHARLAGESRLAVAVQEWFGNDRNPARTVPLILFAPQLLAHPLGHLATALPTLFVFLALLGWSVARRSGSLSYALASMAVFCAVPRLLDPTIGIGPNWLDLPASLLIGGAMLCLLNSDGARDWQWLTAFALLASFAALSRYVAAGFAFVAAGPVLLFYLLQRWRQERRVKAILFPVAVVALVVGVVAGPLITIHLKNNVFYYSALALNYGVNQGAVASAFFLKRFLSDYIDPGTRSLGVLWWGACVAVWFGHACSLYRRGDTKWSDVFVTVWLAGGIALFFIAVLKSSNAPSAALYILPALFAALATPTVVKEPRIRRLLALGSAPLTVIAFGITAHSAQMYWRWAADPALDPAYNLGWVTISGPDIADRKAFDVSLARELSRQGKGLVWSPLFDETGHIHSMEAFYRFGTLVLTAGPRYYSVHAGYWSGFYPGLSPQAIVERVYAATNRWVDVAVVWDETSSEETRISWVGWHADNPTSRYVARDVAARLAKDPRWRKVFRVQSRGSGAVAGYRNLESNGRGYRPLLTGHSLFFTPIDP